MVVVVLMSWTNLIRVSYRTVVVSKTFLKYIGFYNDMYVQREHVVIMVIFGYIEWRWMCEWLIFFFDTLECVTITYKILHKLNRTNILQTVREFSFTTIIKLVAYSCKLKKQNLCRQRKSLLYNYNKYTFILLRSPWRYIIYTNVFQKGKFVLFVLYNRLYFIIPIEPPAQNLCTANFSLESLNSFSNIAIFGVF